MTFLEKSDISTCEDKDINANIAIFVALLPVVKVHYITETAIYNH